MYSKLDHTLLIVFLAFLLLKKTKQPDCTTGHMSCLMSGLRLSILQYVHICLPIRRNFNDLKKVRVCGRPLEISRLGSSASAKKGAPAATRKSKDGARAASKNKGAVKRKSKDKDKKKTKKKVKKKRTAKTRTADKGKPAKKRSGK